MHRVNADEEQLRYKSHADDFVHNLFDRIERYYDMRKTVKLCVRLFKRTYNRYGNHELSASIVVIANRLDGIVSLTRCQPISSLANLVNALE